MKKILAVSGGVDSVVMLEIFLEKYSPSGLVVAHFDHGIRGNSREDAEFLWKTYSGDELRIYYERAELGPDASEAEARKARYDFLRRVASAENGEIYTAHHLDDLVESVAINLTRGTGWRGLAVLDSPEIQRPFLENWQEMGFRQPPDKTELLRYAGRKQLHFREDPTNNSDKYLRNRLREKLGEMSGEDKMRIYRLWQDQKKLKQEIDGLIQEILPDEQWPREIFREMDDETALEILRAGLLRAGVATTQPQRKDFLRAIREYQPGKCFNLPGDKMVRVDSNLFIL